jgi:hypothetical protein
MMMRIGGCYQLQVLRRVAKIVGKSLSHEKHVELTPLSGIGVEKRKSSFLRFPQPHNNNFKDYLWNFNKIVSRFTKWQ